MSTETTSDGLPDVSDERLERIEERVFAAIAEERVARPAGARRRRRVRQGVGVAAAVVAVAAVISPAVLQGMGGGATSADRGVESGAVAPEAQEVPQDATGESGAADSSASSDGGATTFGLGDEDGALADREIVRTGSATVVVDDAVEAADAIAELAAEHDGWVEQLSIGADGSLTGAEPSGDAVWVPDDGGYITIRVPADALDDVMAALDDVGEVSGTRVGTQDVTSQAVDLRARVDAARASVKRLTELLAQSGGVRDLVEVESALSSRQAELESLERQLEELEGQVAMSSLSVSLLKEAPPVEPDPAGFGDGLEAGWNGLLAALNGVVIALGFLLPWLAVAAIVWLIVWALLRAARRRRRRGDDARA